MGSLHQVAKVLELQHQSFQRILRTDFLQDGLVGSPCSPRDSQESSPTAQFKSISSSALSLLSLVASLVAQLVKNHPQWRRPGFNSWVGKIPWRRERLPTPVLWPGEFYGQRSRLDTAEKTISILENNQIDAGKKRLHTHVDVYTHTKRDRERERRT